MGRRDEEEQAIFGQVVKARGERICPHVSEGEECVKCDPPSEVLGDDDRLVEAALAPEQPVVIPGELAPLKHRQSALIDRLFARKETSEHQGQPHAGLQYALDECIDLEEKLISSLLIIVQLRQQVAKIEGERDRHYEYAVKMITENTELQSTIAEKDARIAELANLCARLENKY